MGYKSFGKRRSLRLKHYDYSSPRPIHVIIGIYRRRPYLANRLLVEKLVFLLRAVAEEYGVRVYAYCFMPDHLHLLFSPAVGCDAVRFVQLLKGKSTRVFWASGGKGKLWQRGFYDHVLRKEERLEEVARYILNNPVRKGLVRKASDYPYGGSFVFDIR